MNNSQLQFSGVVDYSLSALRDFLDSSSPSSLMTQLKPASLLQREAHAPSDTPKGAHRKKMVSVHFY
jgi:hypothetical protein